MRLVSLSIFVLGTYSVTSFCAPFEETQKGKAFDHILQVWFENQDFKTVNSLPAWRDIAKEGILLRNFNAITHPSQPNYIAAAAGATFGIQSDGLYRIPNHVSSIFDLLESKGLTWKVYQEDIPQIGFAGLEAGHYVRKHNPAISFDSVANDPNRLKNIVSGIDFIDDVMTDNLPNWMFYSPNVLNDGHDTSAAYAGRWLERFYHSTLCHPNFKASNTLVLLTFDENDSSKKRNRVWSLLLGAIPEELKGTIDDTYYTHYSTLNTVEQNWDLGSLGRGDDDKNANNVFEFLSDTFGYTNMPMQSAKIPLNNEPIAGPLTGKSGHGSIFLSEDEDEEGDE